MSKSTKTLILWALLIMMFAAIWQFLSPEPPPRGAARGAGGQRLAGHRLPRGRARRGPLGLPALHDGGAAAPPRARALLHAAHGRAPRRGRALGVARAGEPACRTSAAAHRCSAPRSRSAAAIATPPSSAPRRPSPRRWAGSGRASSAPSSSGPARSPPSRAPPPATRPASAPTSRPSAPADVEPAALARATLAEAVLLDRAGDRAGLRDLVDRSRTLWPRPLRATSAPWCAPYEAMLDADPPPSTGSRRTAPRPPSGPSSAPGWHGSRPTRRRSCAARPSIRPRTRVKRPRTGRRRRTGSARSRRRARSTRCRAARRRRWGSGSR